MIRVAIVDDEENALNMLEILLSRCGNVHIAGKFTDAQEAVATIGRTPPDAVFLDIEMPELSGMEAARKLQSLVPQLQVVFTTAYAEYAVEAFEIDSLDYLLKPIKMERLQQSLQRIEEAMATRAFPVQPDPMHHIRCMGGFTLYDADRKPLPWRTNKEKELCAFLVHHRGQPVSQEAIMEALWPESDAEKAKPYLYNCTSLLRKKLQSSGLPAAIHTVNNGYCLEMNRIYCDVAELEQRIDVVQQGKESKLSYQMERISALYQGSYMDLCDYTWAIGRQEQLTVKCIQALRTMATSFREGGQSAPAISCLRKIMEIAPDSESDGRELIALLAETGERREAVQAGKQLEEAVRERLDLELEDETQALIQRLGFGVRRDR
ncbi:MAG: histidine kinase [Paenibacillaceae bacterium]|nr:histidine kinase [Paenibacillaceae bacterium]